MTRHPSQVFSGPTAQPHSLPDWLRGSGWGTPPLNLMGVGAGSHFGLSSAVALTDRSHCTRLPLSASSEDRVLLRGLAVPFGVPSDIPLYGQPALGSLLLFRQGAFTQSLQSGRDIWMLFNQDFAFVLGRNRAGTAAFYEAPDGLHFECDPPDTSWASGMLVSIARGDISGCAVAFQASVYHFESRGDYRVAVIERADLIACSVSSWPMFSRSSVSAADRARVAAAANGYDRQFLRKMGIDSQGEVER
jgi:HK97 family phage prohead protease